MEYVIEDQTISRASGARWVLHWAGVGAWTAWTAICYVNEPIVNIVDLFGNEKLANILH